MSQSPTVIPAYLSKPRIFIIGQKINLIQIFTDNNYAHMSEWVSVNEVCLSLFLVSDVLSIMFYLTLLMNRFSSSSDFFSVLTLKKWSVSVTSSRMFRPCAQRQPRTTGEELQMRGRPNSPIPPPWSPRMPQPGDQEWPADRFCLCLPLSCSAPTNVCLLWK